MTSPSRQIHHPVLEPNTQECWHQRLCTYLRNNDPHVSHIEMESGASQSVGCQEYQPKNFVAHLPALTFIVEDRYEWAAFLRPVSPVQMLVELSGINPVVVFHDIMTIGFEPGLFVDGERGLMLNPIKVPREFG